MPATALQETCEPPSKEELELIEVPEKAASESRRRGKKNIKLGKRGEDAAVQYLYRCGYDIIERNWKCGFGEADIIAFDGRYIVFVEVKTRNGINKGFPSEAVGKAKREKYEKIALAYLSECDEVDRPVRFDVISIVVMDSERATIRHHINAFGQA